MDDTNASQSRHVEGKTYLGFSQSPTQANVIDSMWVFNIKWDSEGNRIRDKARLVGKGYMQQLGVDYNETWAGVTRLESIRMTTAIAAKLDLKLW